LASSPSKHPYLFIFLSESVREPEILAILRPMIKHYALERLEGERFGDFTIRVGYIAPTTEGKLWYDRSGGEGENREASD
jgi:sulfite reductase (NADPH) hemoprotein beta-component